jgi:hypothetical protein
VQHFYCGLSNGLPYIPDLISSDCYLFAYLKNWMRLQCFNNSELMVGVKTWLTSQVEDFFDISLQNPDAISVSFQEVTML